MKEDERPWREGQRQRRSSGVRKAMVEEEEDEPFEEKMKRLTAQLEEQFAEGAELEKAIRENLKGLGYGR